MFPATPSQARRLPAEGEAHASPSPHTADVREIVRPGERAGQTSPVAGSHSCHALVHRPLRIATLVALIFRGG